MFVHIISARVNQSLLNIFATLFNLFTSCILYVHVITYILTSLYDSLDEANADFYTYNQGEFDSPAQHLKNFKNLIAVVEHYGGTMFYDKRIIAYEKAMDKTNGKSEAT